MKNQAPFSLFFFHRQMTSLYQTNSTWPSRYRCPRIRGTSWKWPAVLLSVVVAWFCCCRTGPRCFPRVQCCAQWLWKTKYGPTVFNMALILSIDNLTPTLEIGRQSKAKDWSPTVTKQRTVSPACQLTSIRTHFHQYLHKCWYQSDAV